MASFTEQVPVHSKDGHFRAYKPNARGNAARITDKQWEPYFPLIQHLHNTRNTRIQILNALRENGLEPSLAQLYSKMSRWGLKGYGPANNGDDQTEPTQPIEVEEAILPSHSVRLVPNASLEDLSEDSQASSDSADCFSNNDVDTSDTMYDTEGPPVADDCAGPMLVDTSEFPMLDDSISLDSDHGQIATADLIDTTENDSVVSSLQCDATQRLPTDLITFVHSTVDISDFDKFDILNEVGSFLCATSSFSDAFVLFDAVYSFLRQNQGTPMALVFATVNCLRSATFVEQCQYAGSLMTEALASIRLIGNTNPFTAAALSSLEDIGRELCVRSELGYLSILYNQIHFSQTSLSPCGPPVSNTNEVLVHYSDPFLLTKANDRPELFSQSIDVSSLSLGRMVGKLSRWCCSAIEDFNPISMLPSAGFNPSDTMSVARFSTALSCHFIRKWSFLSLPEVLGHCNELLPPNRKDAAARLCKTAVRILSTLAVYTIYQATGVTLRSVAGEECSLLEAQARYVSPLANHLDVLACMGSKERVLVFAAMHKTLYNRTLVYRQQMDDHCLMAHVRETGFLLAASLIRLKRELGTEVPRPVHDISRVQTPVRDIDCLSRRSSDSSSSMRNLARRNLLVPGIMSKNGSHMRSTWTRRLSTDSNDSWNFSKVTGLPNGPSPPESVKGHTQESNNHKGREEHCRCQDDQDHEMSGMDMF